MEKIYEYFGVEDGLGIIYHKGSVFMIIISAIVTFFVTPVLILLLFLFVLSDLVFSSFLIFSYYVFFIIYALNGGISFSAIQVINPNTFQVSLMRKKGVVNRVVDVGRYKYIEIESHGGRYPCLTATLVGEKSEIQLKLLVISISKEQSLIEIYKWSEPIAKWLVIPIKSDRGIPGL